MRPPGIPSAVLLVARCIQVLILASKFGLIKPTLFFGRISNLTQFIGLMFTAGGVYWALQFFNITVQIRNVCVLLAPWFASNTAIVTYFFTKEIWDKSAGLVAAAMIAVVPGSTSHFSPLPHQVAYSFALHRLYLSFCRWFI